MCLISVSLPHGTLSFSQVPACRRQRTVRDRLSSLRYSDSEKRFRMPAALLYTKSSYPGNVSTMVSNQASLAVNVLSAQCASSCSRPYLELSLTHQDATAVPACLHVLKQVISFEVRRHDAASCAIRHELAGCRWLEDTAFWCLQPFGGHEGYYVGLLVY